MSSTPKKTPKLYSTHLTRSQQLITPSRVIVMMWLGWFFLLFTPFKDSGLGEAILIVAASWLLFYVPIRLIHTHALSQWVRTSAVWHVKSFDESFEGVYTLSDYLPHGQSIEKRVVRVRFREYPGVKFTWVDTPHDLRAGQAVTVEYRKHMMINEVRNLREE